VTERAKIKEVQYLWRETLSHFLVEATVDKGDLGFTFVLLSFTLTSPMVVHYHKASPILGQPTPSKRQVDFYANPDVNTSDPVGRKPLPTSVAHPPILWSTT